MESIVLNFVSSYLKLLCKNWKDLNKNFSLNFFTMRAVIKDVQINENVIQEFIPFPFLQVQNCRIDEMIIQLPGITRLTNDPVQIIINKVFLNIAEPIVSADFTTPVSDFFASMSGKSTPTKPNRPNTRLYGMTDRLVDGVSIKINEIQVQMSLLGHEPSKSFGPWTPPVLKICVKDILLQTVDTNFQEINNLYKAIPRLDTATATKHNEMVVHKRGQIGFMEVKFFDPNTSTDVIILSNAQIGSIWSTKMKEEQKAFREGKGNKRYAWNEKQVAHLTKLIQFADNPLVFFASITKRPIGGAFLHFDIELIFEKISMELRKRDISQAILYLVALSNASKREDIQQKFAIFLEEKKKKRGTIPEANPTIANNLSQTSTQTSNSANSMQQNQRNAISSLISPNSQKTDTSGTIKSPQKPGENEDDFSSVSDDDITEGDDFQEDDGFVLPSDTPSGSEKAGNNSSSESTKGTGWEFVDKSHESENTKNSSTSGSATSQQKQDFYSARQTISFKIHEFDFNFLYDDEDSEKKKKNLLDIPQFEPLGVNFEMFGLCVSIVVPEDAPEIKNLQLMVPFLHFKEIFKQEMDNKTAQIAEEAEKSKRSTYSEDELQYIEQKYILRPRTRRYYQDSATGDAENGFSRSQQDLESNSIFDDGKYSIGYPAWPIFEDFSCYYKYSPFPKQRLEVSNANPLQYNLYEALNQYKPHQIYMRRYFSPGNECIRMKFTSSFSDVFVLFRINPMEATIHVEQLFSMMDRLLKTFPDLSQQPKDDDKIILPEPLPLELLPKEIAEKFAKAALHKMNKESDNVILQDDDEIGGNNENGEKNKIISFLIEIRSPVIYLQPNTKSFAVPDQTEAINGSDVAEMICLRTKEIHITSDPSIQRPNCFDSDNFTSKSLFCPENSSQFPAKDSDFTTNHRTIWESLPSKYKFKLGEFVIELLPSFKSPAQKLMEPISMMAYLGVNDKSISHFHKKLPQFVLMVNADQIDFHVDQNQFIMLMEFGKTFADNPPDFGWLFVENTKTFVSKNRKILASNNLAFARFASKQQQEIEELEKQNQSVLNKGRKEKEKINSTRLRSIVSVLSAFRIEKVTFTIKQCSKDVVEFFSHSSTEVMPSVLCLEIRELESLVETHQKTRMLNFKIRVDSSELRAVPKKNEPSSILLTTISRKPRIIVDKQKTPISCWDYVDLAHNPKDYAPAPFLLLRFEQPLCLVLRKDPKDSLDDLKLMKNSTLVIEGQGVHLGLNTDSILLLKDFFYSKENFFDISPVGMLSRTVSKTYEFVKKKYLNKKQNKVENEPNDKPIEKKKNLLDDLLFGDNGKFLDENGEEEEEAVEENKSVEKEKEQKSKMSAIDEDAISKIELLDSEKAENGPINESEIIDLSEAPLGLPLGKNNKLNVPEFKPMNEIISKTPQDKNIKENEQINKTEEKTMKIEQIHKNDQEKVKIEQEIPRIEIKIKEKDEKNMISLQFATGIQNFGSESEKEIEQRLVEKKEEDFDPLQLSEPKKSPMDVIKAAAGALGHEEVVLSEEQKIDKEIQEQKEKERKTKEDKEQIDHLLSNLSFAQPTVFTEQKTEKIETQKKKEDIPLFSVEKEEDAFASFGKETKTKIFEEKVIEGTKEVKHQQTEQEKPKKEEKEVSRSPRSQKPETNQKSPEKAETIAITPEKQKTSLYPVLWEANFKNCEIVLIDDGNTAPAVGIILPSIKITHLPTSEIEKSQKEEELKNYPKFLHKLKEEDQESLSYSTKTHKFDIYMEVKDGNACCLLPCVTNEAKTSNSPKKPMKILRVMHIMNEKPFGMAISIINNYNEALSKREIKIHSMNPWAGRIEPQALLALSKVLRKQVGSAAQTIGATFDEFLTQKNREKNQHLFWPLLDSLVHHLEESHRAITKTEVEHLSLVQYITALRGKLQTTSEALEEAIEGKTKAYEFLSEMQMSYSRGSGNSFSGPIKGEINPKTSILNSYANQQAELAKIKPKIMREISGRVLNQADWKKVQIVLIEKVEKKKNLRTDPVFEVLFSTAQSTNPVQDYFNEKFLQKNKFSVFRLSAGTEVLEMKVPVDNPNQPQPVIALINDDQSKVFFNMKAAKDHSDWLKSIYQTVEILKLSDNTEEIAIQTEESFLEEMSKQEEEARQIEVEKIKKQAEKERKELISLVENLQQITQMQQQYDATRDHLSHAKEEQAKIRVAFSKMSKLIRIMEKEQEKRAFFADEQRKLEVKRAAEIDKVKEEYYRLKNRNSELETEKAELDKKASSQEKKIKDLKEEQELLKDNHINSVKFMETEYGKLEKERNQLKKQLEIYSKKENKLEKKSAKKLLKIGSGDTQKYVDDQHRMNLELKKLVSELYTKNDEFKSKFEQAHKENIELRSKLNMPLPKEEILTTVSEPANPLLASAAGTLNSSSPNKEKEAETEKTPPKTLPTIPSISSSENLKNLEQLPQLPQSPRSKEQQSAPPVPPRRRLSTISEKPPKEFSTATPNDDSASDSSYSDSPSSVFEQQMNISSSRRQFPDNSQPEKKSQKQQVQKTIKSLVGLGLKIGKRFDEESTSFVKDLEKNAKPFGALGMGFARAGANLLKNKSSREKASPFSSPEAQNEEEKAKIEDEITTQTIVAPLPTKIEVPQTQKEIKTASPQVQPTTASTEAPLAQKFVIRREKQKETSGLSSVLDESLYSYNNNQPKSSMFSGSTGPTSTPSFSKPANTTSLGFGNDNFGMNLEQNHLFVKKESSPQIAKTTNSTYSPQIMQISNPHNASSKNSSIPPGMASFAGSMSMYESTPQQNRYTQSPKPSAGMLIIDEGNGTQFGQKQTNSPAQKPQIQQPKKDLLFFGDSLSNNSSNSKPVGGPTTTTTFSQAQPQQQQKPQSTNSSPKLNFDDIF